MNSDQASMMQPVSSQLSPQQIARLQGLQLRARAVVESVLAGSHRSTRRGFSVEFAEHRDYAPGDDVRYLDWKLLARRDRYYVRQFEDETRFKLICLLDVSRSMTYRSENAALSKLDYAAVLAASLLWLVQKQRDECGLICFDQGIQLWSPANLQGGWLQQLLAQLQSTMQRVTSDATAISTTDEPDLNCKLLHESLERLPARSLVVLLTDGFGEVDQLARVMRHARSRRQDLRLVQVLDPAELQFPFQEPTRFHGLESGKSVTLSGASIRDVYLQEFRKFLRELEHACRQEETQYCRIETSEDFFTAIRRITRFTER